MFNKRAISEVIGALLMISLSVTGGVIVYVYASGLMGPLQGAKVHQPYMEKVTMDYYQWSMMSTSSGSLTLMLRNTGSAQLTLADFFMAGQPVTASFGSGCSSGKLNVNAAGCQVTISYTGLSFTKDVSYNVRVVTTDGAIFDYSCIAGETS